MKTPEEVLKQVVVGEIYCFRCKKNHPENIFDACVKSFARETISIEACYWKLMRGRMTSEEFRGIKASYYIRPNQIATILLNYAYDLHSHLQKVTTPFFSIRNMARFSSVSEAVRHIPKDGVREFCLPIDIVKKLREYYIELTKTVVVGMSLRSPYATLSVNHNSHNIDYRVLQSDIIKYLQTLTGHRSARDFVVFVSGQESDAIRVGKDASKFKFIKLKSLVTYEIADASVSEFSVN